MNKRIKNKNKKGFSIIEVIVSCLLLSVCVIVVMDAFVIGAYFKKNTESSATALFLAQSFMEQTLSDSAAVDIEGDCPEPYQEYKYKITLKNIPGMEILWQVDVQVSVTSGRFNKTIKLTALKQGPPPPPEE